METIVGNAVKDQLSGATDTSGQPWYWKWGIAALGVIGGIVLFFGSLSSLVSLGLVEGLIKMAFACILICFEATALAKGFNWTFCQALVGIAEKVPALVRTVVYAALSIVLIILTFSNIFVCLPAMLCAAAYFMLFLDTRNSSETLPDEEPVVNDEFA